MMMPTGAMIVIVAMATVRAAFGLKGYLHLHEFSSEAMKHFLDHVVGSNAKNVFSNFSRQMPVSQMPGKAHELIGILVPDFDNRLRSGLHLEQSSIVKLQGVPIGHRNRFRKIEKDIQALIRPQANAPAVARVEIERESAGRHFFRPMSGGPMN
jgi:hypothetical protein